MKIEHTGTPQTNALRLAGCELEIDRLKEHIALQDQRLEWALEDLDFVKKAFREIMANYDKQSTDIGAE